MLKQRQQRTTKAIIASVKKHQVTIENWEHLHKCLSKMTDTGWIFRGVSAPNHYLIPSVGREKVFGPYKAAQEERLFHEFKDRVLSIVDDTRFNEWDWLAFAQHLGVPTRLLDWTTTPLVAAFFALQEDSEEDRVIYGFKYSKYLYEVDHKRINPFENKQEGRFSAPLLFDRIRAQRGVFTIHPIPTKIFDPPELKSFLIPNNLVKKFRKQLFKFGIDFWHIYPDTEGLGQQLRWQYTNKIGLGSVFKIKK